VIEILNMVPEKPDEIGNIIIGIELNDLLTDHFNPDVLEPLPVHHFEYISPSVRRNLQPRC
jgi:hypothetical protein